MKGESIFDAVRTIDDILEYTKHKKMSGILVAIDFEKAFDALDHTYLLKVLHAFNFGPSFIQWIRTFYSNISTEVASLIMALHQIISQLVVVCGRETHYHLFSSY